MAYCRCCPLLSTLLPELRSSDQGPILAGDFGSTLVPIFEHQDPFLAWSYGKQRKNGHAPCGNVFRNTINGVCDRQGHHLLC
ncbi:hypothetical protein L207DRAFT_512717 [Hyaloscypha variabilis F]|uniref:Uncharacterized protein n=1 Tax=Hyaloscypha variabilis (strain UAMH 11265 / GT02V1 / F) TaxID=1149755 RepID=A0A2J6RMK3_HYAVF|nr:hypothetical protein L207DRAFT_512717 [Hyaloscypha variabilis F]